MSSIIQKLEQILDEQLDTLPVEQINELVNLITLDDKECEQKFSENKILNERYFPSENKEQVFVLKNEESRTFPVKKEEPETEESSSDMEMSPRQRTYNASTSRGNRRRKKDTEFSMPYHKGIPNSNSNKNGSSTTIDTINIDCIFGLEKRKEVIDKWNTEISLIIQTNSDEFSNAKALLLLMEHKSAGIIQNFIKGTTWDENMNGDDLFDQIINAIYMMFLGLDFITNKDHENQKLLEKARQNLAKAQICDICLLDDFTCLYETNLYKLSTGEFHSWIEAYLMKIPIVGEKAKERWNKEKNQFTMHSLGFATRIVKEEIAVYCDFSDKQKQLKRFNKSCCKKLTELPQLTFGCEPVKDENYFKKKYKNKYKTKTKKRFWKTKKRKFSPGKYFSKEKPKVCPQGKKKCRCWICSEEGHYANECPNRQKFPEKLKIISKAETEGYFPSENIFDGYTQVYTLEILDNMSSDSSTEDSE